MFQQLNQVMQQIKHNNSTRTKYSSLRPVICLVFLLGMGCFLIVSCKKTPVWNVEERLTKTTDLPTSVYESSGLAIIQQQLWTINDSGNPPVLYQVAKDSDSLLHTLTINNASNNDWEELATDENNLYIGDFGNNGGNRQNLTIYEVPLSSMSAAFAEANYIRTLSFQYADQQLYNHPGNLHNFDCEAMIALGGQLYLFSKNRADQQCNLYQLDIANNNGVAQKMDSFDSNGLITGADYDLSSNTLALVGYRMPAADQFEAFVWLFYGFSGRDFFGGKQHFIDLKLYEQAEGIVFLETQKLLISTEVEMGGKGALFELNLNDLVLD